MQFAALLCLFFCFFVFFITAALCATALGKAWQKGWGVLYNFDLFSSIPWYPLQFLVGHLVKLRWRLSTPHQLKLSGAHRCPLSSTVRSEDTRCTMSGWLMGSPQDSQSSRTSWLMMLRYNTSHIQPPHLWHEVMLFLSHVWTDDINIFRYMSKIPIVPFQLMIYFFIYTCYQLYIQPFYSINSYLHLLLNRFIYQLNKNYIWMFAPERIQFIFNLMCSVFSSHTLKPVISGNLKIQLNM